MLIARHAPRNIHAIAEVLHDTGGYLAALTETGCADRQLWAGYGHSPIKHLLELLLDLRSIAHSRIISPAQEAPMKRALLPSLNPTGIGSAAAAIYAAAVMIWNATHHLGVIDPQVIVAALGAAGFLYARFKVTPVADPKDGNGNPLTGPAVNVVPPKTLPPPSGPAA